MIHIFLHSTLPKARWRGPARPEQLCRAQDGPHDQHWCPSLFRSDKVEEFVHVDLSAHFQGLGALKHCGLLAFWKGWLSVVQRPIYSSQFIHSLLVRPLKQRRLHHGVTRAECVECPPKEMRYICGGVEGFHTWASLVALAVVYQAIGADVQYNGSLFSQTIFFFSSNKFHRS